MVACPPLPVGSSSAPMKVPMQMPASSGHNRRSSASQSPPAVNCQILVTSDGSTRIAAACAGVIISPSSPIATVGRPSPMVPLTKPASK